MRRREFLWMIGGAATTLTGPAFGQRLVKIGYLSAQHRPTSFSDHVFLTGMRALGYTEGMQYQVDWRYAEGRYDRLRGNGG